MSVIYKLFDLLISLVLAMRVLFSDVWDVVLLCVFDWSVNSRDGYKMVTLGETFGNCYRCLVGM